MSAAAKKATKTKAPAAPAGGSDAERAVLLAQSQQIPIKYDPVMIALSKAEAAHCLLAKNQDGLFDDDDTAEWVEAFATDTLREALVEAKAAYVKAVGDKTAPKAEAAR